VLTLNAVPIRAPYVDWILDGHKVWESRSRATKIRGLVGLIKSKSLTVVGTCRIVDVIGPLTLKDIRENAQAKINEPPADCRDCEGAYAWVLVDVRRLDTPVPYHHLSGAVTWVNLDETTAARIAKAPGTTAAASTPRGQPRAKQGT
jgi:hypothetical protein